MTKMTPETIARRAAARKEEKKMAALKSVANDVNVLECSTRDLCSIEVMVEGTWLKGLIENVNPLLERLGYRPVRITSNMLNPKSKLFAIDINTPSYCDPGCESYHSM